MQPNVEAVNSPAGKAAIAFHPSVVTNFSTFSETAGPNLVVIHQASRDSEIPFSKRVPHLGEKISKCSNGPFNLGTSL